MIVNNINELKEISLKIEPNKKVLTYLSNLIVLIIKKMMKIK
jgi:hypothetical protein